MPINPTISGQIVLDYLEDNPTMPSATLARMILADKANQKVFSSTEQIRSLIRYYRESSGSKSAGELKNKKYAEIWGKVSVPEGETEIKERVYVIPKAHDNILLISDIHVPYHDKKAIESAIKWAKEREINTVVILGDFLDMYHASKFGPDPRYRDLQHEFDIGYEVLYYIQNNLPKAKIYWLDGNHEHRIERYLIRKAKELLGMDVWEIPNLMKFSDFRIEYLPYLTLVKIGNLMAGHGDQFFRGSFSPVNPARTFFMKAKTNFIGGDRHTSSSHSGNVLTGENIRCWSVGCLCNLYPKFAIVNEWNHGFARIRQYEDGNFDCFNAVIEKNGRVSG